MNSLKTVIYFYTVLKEWYGNLFIPYGIKYSKIFL